MAQPTGAGRTKSRQKLYAALDELYTGIYHNAPFTCTSPATSTLNALESLEVFDASGASIGFLALYGDEDLTTA